MKHRRSSYLLQPKIVRMRLVGSPADVNDLLSDLTTTRWAFGKIDTYTHRDGSTGIYAQLKRVQP